MSELIKHECGIGLIRLLKPLEYYQEKYGSALWGLNKMYLLMEKQRNRGQDGAGLAVVKMNTKPGRPYMNRIRDNQTNPWTNIFKQVDGELEAFQQNYPETFSEAEELKLNFRFAGEAMLGHLRYGTHGSYGIENCHPVVRNSEYVNRSLALAGNFNLTNVGYLFQKLVELGQHPKYMTDTETVLERIGHFLDVANEHLYDKFKKSGYTRNEITKLISSEMNLVKVLKNAAKPWDGGYVIGGIVGNGDAFVVRDPNGIRPCYYYHNDEFVVAASERSTISTVFNLRPFDIQELAPGHIMSIKAQSNQIKIKPFTKPDKKLSCSFERIYFSRGTDVKIYKERKQLGREVVPQVLKSIDYDLDNTVFGYIPNTAETAFWGMVKEVEQYLNDQKVEWIKDLGKNANPEEISRIINIRPRVEKVIIKDVKMRTFIADDSSRDDMVAHVYDVTRGIIRNEQDNLVLIDDSIVRGTTLKKSILQIIARLRPKKIVIVSSAPQIRYPDCYGIDMSQIEKLVAFQAAIELLKERGQEKVIDKVYRKIMAMKAEDTLHERNVVQDIYAPFTEEEISQKITEIVCPKDFPIETEIVYLPLEKLSKAIPDHLGDWYFSGNYPTPGGNRIVNQAYLNFYEGKSERAYQVV
ncbi:amidophosphoribosyltransferase [Pontibacter sp. G13]|uniref:amidophosphoribosyltransferase n=1 Tax=Pontibacter sp. G13 TaxID=3074898 RepID=UPI0028896C7B|nr:amidophosphoribosyltransferase [Pontibacter sp. G13]WNJ16689.1 amidophosphoribosyltransferase [Pontibacter sp. G13]